MSSEIIELVRKNPRERLLVEPLKWTHRQVEVLGCSFQSVEMAETDKDSHDNDSDSKNAKDATETLDGSDGELQVTKEPSAAAARTLLARRRLAAGQIAPISQLLYEDKGPFTVTTQVSVLTICLHCPFRFWNRKFRLYSTIYGLPQFRPYKRLWEASYFILTSREEIEQQVALHNKRKKITYDPRPYIVAALISLAQTQAASQDSWLTSEVECQLYDVCAGLLDLESYSEGLYMYNARIPASFLAKFGFPKGLERPVPGTPNGLVIEVRQVPFEPFDTLRQRLLDLIPWPDGMPKWEDIRG
ncbi:hypothetical protein SPI_03654 [Niveomyces insectorum RCEF 264]|uniref:Uncharacterized protein n=1 Tax=Niveomyces insectorum RCEF 264 TaxID=1081102 RepID=A0A167W963_9HYPO|nr:hypothetical protein SPI_03654 [Niveomyces insectorum RCEF 264]